MKSVPVLGDAIAQPDVPQHVRQRVAGRDAGRLQAPSAGPGRPPPWRACGRPARSGAGPGPRSGRAPPCAGACSTATVTGRLSTWSTLAADVRVPLGRQRRGLLSSSSFFAASASASEDRLGLLGGLRLLLGGFSPRPSSSSVRRVLSRGPPRGARRASRRGYPFSVGAITATSRSRRPVRFCRVYSSGPPRILTGIGRVSSVS